MKIKTVAPRAVVVELFSCSFREGESVVTIDTDSPQYLEEVLDNVERKEVAKV